MTAALRNLWFQIVLWFKFTWASLRTPRDGEDSY
jgi:hypothetical protein